MKERNVVTVGFAAGKTGGVAYAMLGVRPGDESVMRTSFACRPAPALQGRDIAYAALNAVAGKLLARGLRNIELQTEDGNVPLDLSQRRPLPAALTVPYVTLRCTLNRFAAAAVTTVAGPLTRDLTARARAEASLDVAA
jgi:hypothetical protein